MSGPEWHYQPDGEGGFDVYDVGTPRRAANQIRALGLVAGLFVLIGVCGAVLKALDFLADHSGFIFFIIIPALALLGLIQYPIVRIVDRIRRVRYPEHRFLRLWCLVSVVMIVLAAGYPVLLLLPHFVMHPGQALHLARLVIQDV